MRPDNKSTIGSLYATNHLDYRNNHPFFTATCCLHRTIDERRQAEKNNAAAATKVARVY